MFNLSINSRVKQRASSLYSQTRILPRNHLARDAMRGRRGEMCTRLLVQGLPLARSPVHVSLSQTDNANLEFLITDRPTHKGSEK